MSEAIIRQAAIESWDDHVEAWHHFGRQVDGAAWGRAEVAASLERKYGDGAAEKFAEEVGFSRRSIDRFAATFRAFPENGQRCPDLTFSHHLLAAIHTTTPEGAHDAIEFAAHEGLSANALRAYLTKPELPEPATCDTEAGTCGPVTEKDKAFHVAALVDGLRRSFAVYEAIKEYDIDALFRSGGTKKSLRELSAQIDPMVKWLQSLKETIQRRVK